MKAPYSPQYFNQMNRHNAIGFHRQQGVAVIMALLLTTLAITIVASLFWQQQVQVRSIENQRLQLQKQWILRGALDWAGLILREDGKHSSLDTLDEPWAVPLAETRLDQYVENGRADADITDSSLSGSISDAQALFNLTNLCVNGTINPSMVAAFEQMLINAEIDPSLAQATADAMASAQISPATGAANTNTPAKTPDDPLPINLTQVDDLLAVPGFTPELLDKLKSLVIFLPRATPINVNTAAAEVLAAGVAGLSLTNAKLLVEQRNVANFRDLADFSQRLQSVSLNVSASNASVTTNFFLVNGKVRMSRAGLDVKALIERNSTNTKLIWIREY